MQQDSLDRDFRAFQQRRDLAALAAVFDAAAPRLLLVAMHLCRDAATAEDLVQTVFLQVLRDADRFDARRPVMPWLLGLLEHRASDLRRSAHARRVQGGDTATVTTAPTNVASPEDAAAANEVRERVGEALAGMPHDYRDVLALRLVHGLSAVDIAHAHGLPPATVRTRLRRGLELLRGALPRGLATRGLLTLLAAELAFARDGLAAVRTKVLAAAAAGTGVGVTIALGWWLALAATLLLGAGGWWWLAPSVSPTRSDAGATPVVAANEVDEPVLPRTRDGDADTTQPTAQRTAVDDPRITTIRGRAVDANTGMPIGGVEVKVDTYAQNGIEDPEWRDPEPRMTAADGSFAVKFVPSRNRGVNLGLAAEGYVEEFESWDSLREGIDVDVGDVKLRLGTPVHLRLVCNGQPLGGVETGVRQAPGNIRPGSVGGSGVSDADGYVDLGLCEPGPWRYDAGTAHLGNEALFDVPLQREPFVFAVELRNPPRDRSISGVLVDTKGMPVSDVDLLIPWPSGGWLCSTTRTDGGFLWFLAMPPPGSVRERIELSRSRQNEFEWVHDGGEVAWGTHDLRLVVRRRARSTLRLEVFDAATHRPVEAFGASTTASVPTTCSAERRRVAIEPHPGGVATFELAPGEYLASAFPGEPFAENAEIPVRLDEGRTTTLRVPLRPSATLDVDVVDPRSGQALAGVELALMKVVVPENTRDVPSHWFQDLREYPESVVSSSTFSFIVLARGTTNTSGRISLRAPADLKRLVLVAGGPRCVASEHHDVELPAEGGRTTIRVQPAAVVSGTLGPRVFVERCGPSPDEIAAATARARIEWFDPEELVADYPRVVLRALDGEPSSRLTANVAADGTFTITGVPAGRYAVHVDAIVGNVQREFGPFATITMDPERPTPPLALDVVPFVPARGTVLFFVDGKPANGEAGLQRLVDGGNEEIRFRLDADGRATTPWVLEGTYVPFVRVGDHHRVLGADRLVVRAGVDFTTTFALQRRDVTITIVDPHGAPAVGCVVWGEQLDQPELGTGSHWWLNGRTGPDGRLVLPAPSGRLRFRAFARDQDLRERDVQPALLLGDVAANTNAATFRLPR